MKEWIYNGPREFAHKLAGVPGRMHLIAKNNGSGKQLWLTQKWISERRAGRDEYGNKIRLCAEVRFDDSCNNGHNSFCVTGDYDVWYQGRWNEGGGGRCDELIAKIFPELAYLQKWNLASNEGPMYYVGNTTYHAGNRDHWGKAEGEPTAWDTYIKFGNFPIGYELKNAQLKEVLQDYEGHYEDLVILEIPHKKEPGKNYNFKPKYTFNRECEWYQCPFDYKFQADDFRKALCNYPYEIVKIPTAWSEGKERDLQAARDCAVWPEATDEQLMLPKEELTKLLEARLPALIEQMKKDLTDAGLFWDTVAEWTIINEQ